MPPFRPHAVNPVAVSSDPWSVKPHENRLPLAGEGHQGISLDIPLYGDFVCYVQSLSNAFDRGERYRAQRRLPPAPELGAAELGEELGIEVEDRDPTEPPSARIPTEDPDCVREDGACPRCIVAPAIAPALAPEFVPPRAGIGARLVPEAM